MIPQMKSIWAGVLMLGMMAATVEAADAAAGSAPAGKTADDAALNVAFNGQTQWTCYHLVKTSNRLKVLRQDAYATPQEGDFFKVVQVETRHYVQDAKQRRYEDSWETAPDFTDRFVDYLSYYQEVKQQDSDAKQQVQALKKQIADNEKQQAGEKNQITQLNHTVSALNNKIRHTKNNAGLRHQEEAVTQKLQDHKDKLGELTTDDKDLKKQLADVQKKQQKLDALFKVISKNPDGKTADQIAAATKPAVAQP